MAEEKSNTPAIRIWAPAPEASPEAHGNMQHLADKIEVLEDILGRNGVIVADIMPPLRRRGFVPDEDKQYEIFAQPSTLGIGVNSEGSRIQAAIDEIFGLLGSLRNPMASDAVRDAHIKGHGLSLLSSRNLTEPHVS